MPLKIKIIALFEKVFSKIIFNLNLLAGLV